MPRPPDAPPIALLALQEQSARFLPWQRALSPQFRVTHTAWRIDSLIADADRGLPGAAVTASTDVPFLANVRW